ncbi:MAG: hypothetical protein GX336_03920 [Halanaerobiaceae bacterium]|nr:hypothetical protein [Halanaerobiaceae bacterium]
MNPERIIGIDIDGVITDETHINDNIWHDALCNYLGYEIERVKDSYYFDEAYDLSLEIINDFLEKNIATIYANARLAVGARETINYLYDKGFEIHLITAREPEFKELTREWLDNNGLLYTSLYHEEDKAPLAVKKRISLFLEDNAYNTEAMVSKGIPVLLFDKFHNRHIRENKDIIRVSDWTEARKHIQKFYSL